MDLLSFSSMLEHKLLCLSSPEVQYLQKQRQSRNSNNYVMVTFGKIKIANNYKISPNILIKKSYDFPASNPRYFPDLDFICITRFF